MLAMVRQGLRDMEESDHDRVLLGFCGVVVFGRSVTFAMQNLRTFDRDAFKRWYGPWLREMTTDPLLLYFHKLRTQILHGISPSIGIVLVASGQTTLRPGSITVNGPRLPETHRGMSITDTSMENLCRLYLAYLEAMFESLSPVVWEVSDRFYASQGS